MRLNFRNTAKFLVYYALSISTCESLIVTEDLDAFNSSVSKNEGNVILDAETKFKWILSGDMVKKVPIERRLDNMNDIMSNYEEEFCHGDSNDMMQPRSTSGQDSFWELYDQLDKGKKAPIYNTQGGGSRPVLSKFRYIIVPIWWQDEDITDPDKIIQTKVIDDVMNYNQQYYKRMSFGKFEFDEYILLPQEKIPLSSKNPSFGDLEAAARTRVTDGGYTADVDYNGLIILYNTAKNGPFSGHGGWGTVNSGSSVTWMSWRWGLSNGVARHEIGHNFGHPHHLTNGYKWRFGQEGVVGYDDYDMMSGGNGYDISDFALASKWFFGWVPDSAIINMQPQGSTSNCPKCVSQGTYKLYPLDGDDATKLMGVHIPVTRQGNTLYSYWLSYRSGNPAIAGLSVHISWFDGVGGGQFGASYNSLNYDAHGDTETREDSFVLPGTCYHIPPSVKMLEIDPVASIATQPVVCVTQMAKGRSITVNVSFVGTPSPTKDRIVMECGTSVNIDVESKTDQLIHVDNTGVDGILTLSGSSSATAQVFIYDRYPTSPLKYSAPGAYGAFMGMTMPTKSETLTNGGSDQCMHMSLNPENNVSIKKCNGGQEQSWKYDLQTKRIINDGGRCLDVNVGDNQNIITWSCHEGSNQKWERDDANESFKSLYNQRCMTVENNKNIRLFDCNNGGKQKFSPGAGTDPTIEYRAMHNEAWILVTAQSEVTIEASCVVNKCQVGQKEEGGKCVTCKGDDDSCEKCPGGLEFLISTCVLTDTVKAISSSKKWRIWAPKFHTLRGWVWDLFDIKFYSNHDCTGDVYNDGTAIDSGNAGGGWVPTKAFDSSDRSAWGGRADNNGLFWIGMEFNVAKNVGCVSILDHKDNGVSELRIQAWESSTKNWQNVKISKDYDSGQRQDISLEGTSSPVAAPQSAPTMAPVGSVKCNELSKTECKNQKEVCRYNKKKKIWTDCKAKRKKYEHDCKKYDSSTQCRAVDGLCRWNNGVCSHVCDDLAVKVCKNKRSSADNKKMCKMPKIKNPCFGCHPKTEC